MCASEPEVQSRAPRRERSPGGSPFSIDARPLARAVTAVAADAAPFEHQVGEAAARGAQVGHRLPGWAVVSVGCRAHAVRVAEAVIARAQIALVAHRAGLNPFSPRRLSLAFAVQVV